MKPYLLPDISINQLIELTRDQPLARRDGLRDLQPIRPRGGGRANKEIEGNARISRLEDGDPELDGEFVGTQTIRVAKSPS